MRFSGLGMPTRPRASMAMARAASLVTFWWAQIISTIWLPTLKTGSREVIGSWKIMAISLPRRATSCFLESFIMSTPSKSISPPMILPFWGSSRMMEVAVTLLPEPDSPTMPMVLPASRVKLTPSTAFAMPVAVWKYVFRSLTESTCSLIGRSPRSRPCRVVRAISQKGQAYFFILGSITSRIPSPSRLKPSTVTRMKMPDTVEMMGWLPMTSLPL